MLLFVCNTDVSAADSATANKMVTGVTWESTDTTVTLTWDEYPGATSYGVQIYVEESNEPYFE